MHFEVLVEDASGKIALEFLLEKVLALTGVEHSSTIHSYRGIGRLPKGMKPKTDVTHRILLDQLPRLLRGFGNSLQRFPAVVVVVVDLDVRDESELQQEMEQLLKSCNPPPSTVFCLAIEEMEAWLLGDRNAVMKAYPRAKKKVLGGYEQDAICGTWEVLANAVHRGGAAALLRDGWPAPGRAKCKWAETIAPHVDVEANSSASFQAFRDRVREAAG